jgi:hypothetical protein
MITTAPEARRVTSPHPWPLFYHWTAAGNPLPRRAVRWPGRPHSAAHSLGAPSWLNTGRVEEPFDFCGHMRRLCADLIVRCPTLEHIDVNHLLFGITQARTRRPHGLQARVTPLRFRNGRLDRRRRGIAYQVQRHFVDDQEMLYLVTFCLLRFLDQDFDDKFITIFHELYHISPEFDGDLRRHGGRCTVHSRSKREYDKHMADLARAYLASGPDAALHAFLRLNFAQLQQRHGSVVGVVVPRPKVVPIPV